MSYISASHIAFDLNGQLRKGYYLTHSSIEGVVSDYDEYVYAREDGVLSDEELIEKVNRIPKQFLMPIAHISENIQTLRRVFSRLDSKHRQYLVLHLKKAHPFWWRSIKNSLYFELIVDRLKKANPEFAARLEPYLVTNPRIIPFLLSLLERNRDDLYNYFIQITEGEDINRAYKLIQAIVLRIDDLRFPELIDCVRQKFVKNKTSLQWLEKLIKHDLLLAIHTQSPKLLDKILYGKTSYSFLFLKYYKIHSGFIAQHFNKLQRFSYLPECIFNSLRTDRLFQAEGECLVNLPDVFTVAKATKFLKVHENASAFIDIYRDEIGRVFDLINKHPAKKNLSDYVTLLKSSGFPTEELETWYWGDIPTWYWLKKKSPEGYPRFVKWARSFFPDRLVDSKHPYYNLFNRAVDYLSAYPKRLGLFLDLVEKDPRLAIRLVECSVDFTQLPPPQLDLFVTLLNAPEFNAKQMSRFYHCLRHYPLELCEILGNFHTMSPAVFAALVKCGTHPEVCSSENFEWIVRFANDNPEISFQNSFALLFRYNLVFNGTSQAPNLNSLIAAMRNYAGDIHQAFAVFAGNPQALYDHLTGTAQWRTDILVDRYRENADYHAIIDGSCRLASIQEWTILDSVFRLIVIQKFNSAKVLINLVLTGNRAIAHEVCRLLWIDEEARLVTYLMSLAKNDRFEDFTYILQYSKEPNFNPIFYDFDYIQFFRQLTLEERSCAYLELTSGSNDHYCNAARKGNASLARLLLKASPEIISSIKNLPSSNLMQQHYLEQYLTLAEVAQEKGLNVDKILAWCRGFHQREDFSDVVILVGKLLFLIDINCAGLGDLYDKPVNEGASFIYDKFGEHCGQILGDSYQHLLIPTLKRDSLHYYTQAEALVCDAFAKLLVMDNNRFNFGLCALLLSSRQHLGYQSLQLFKIDDHLTTMLEQFQTNSELRDVITSVRLTNPQNSPLKTFIAKCLGTKESLTTKDLQRTLVAAMLSRLRQDDLGSCFATHLSIQIQQKQPVQKAKDLKEILERECMTRVIDGHEVRFPLIIPDYIFNKTPRAQNGLLQVWDFSIANMSGTGDRMLDRVVLPAQQVISNFLGKVGLRVDTGLNHQVSSVLKRKFTYIYDPNIRHETHGGVFSLHCEADHDPCLVIKDHRSVGRHISRVLSNFIQPAFITEIFRHHSIEKKLEELGTVGRFVHSSRRLLHKKNKKAILSFSGGYGGSVLQKYFPGKQLYEETFTGHHAEEVFEHLVRLSNSFSSKSIVSFFILGHVCCFNQGQNLRETELVKMKQTGEKLRQKPFTDFRSRIEEAIKTALPTIQFQHVWESLRLDDKTTVAEFFTELKWALEKVLGKTECEDVYSQIDAHLAKVLVDLYSLRIIPLLYTNWYREFLFDNRFLYGFSDYHFAFGYRLSSGNIGVYKISMDGAIYTPISFEKYFKTYKIRFMV